MGDINQSLINKIFGITDDMCNKTIDELFLGYLADYKLSKLDRIRKLIIAYDCASNIEHESLLIPHFYNLLVGNYEFIDEMDPNYRKDNNHTFTFASRVVYILISGTNYNLDFTKITELFSDYELERFYKNEVRNLYSPFAKEDILFKHKLLYDPRILSSDYFWKIKTPDFNLHEGFYGILADEFVMRDFEGIIKVLTTLNNKFIYLKFRNYLNELYDQNNSYSHSYQSVEDKEVCIPLKHLMRIFLLHTFIFFKIYSDTDYEKEIDNMQKKPRKHLETLFDDSQFIKDYLILLKGFNICYVNGIENIITIKKYISQEGYFGRKTSYVELMSNPEFKENINKIITIFIKSKEIINLDLVSKIAESISYEIIIDSKYKLSQDIYKFFVDILINKININNKHLKYEIVSSIVETSKSNNILREFYKDNAIKGLIKFLLDYDFFKVFDNSDITHDKYQNLLKTINMEIELNNIKLLLNNEEITQYMLKLSKDYLLLLDNLKDLMEAHKANRIPHRNLKDILSSHKKTLSEIIISHLLILNLKKKKQYEEEIVKTELLRSMLLEIIKTVDLLLPLESEAIYMNVIFSPLYKKCLKLFTILMNKKNFTEIIVDFELKNFKKILKINYIKKYDTIEEIKNLIDKSFKNEIELPEEFLDPLIFIKILDPIMIPNVDLIFDKSSIMSQINLEKINPYTREKLDVDILNEYNKKEEVKKKVEEFNKKLADFKKLK